MSNKRVHHSLSSRRPFVFLYRYPFDRLSSLYNLDFYCSPPGYNQTKYDDYKGIYKGFKKERKDKNRPKNKEEVQLRGKTVQVHKRKKENQVCLLTLIKRHDKHRSQCRTPTLSLRTISDTVTKTIWYSRQVYSHHFKGNDLTFFSKSSMERTQSTDLFMPRLYF